MGGFGFLRGVGGVGDGRSDGDGRQRQKTVSGGTVGGVRESSGTSDSRRQERGQSEATRAAE